MDQPHLWCLWLGASACCCVSVYLPTICSVWCATTSYFSNCVYMYTIMCVVALLHFYILVFPSIKLPLLFTFLFLIHALYTSCYFMMHAFPMCPIAYHLTQHDVCIPRASTIAVRCSVTYLSCALWFCGLSPCVFLSINLLMCSAYSMFTKHKRNRNSGRKMQFIRLRLGNSGYFLSFSWPLTKSPTKRDQYEY